MTNSKGGVFGGRVRGSVGEGVHDRCCLTQLDLGGLMDTDLDTLATALYARIDDT